MLLPWMTFSRDTIGWSIVQLSRLNAYSNIYTSSHVTDIFCRITHGYVALVVEWSRALDVVSTMPQKQGSNPAEGPTNMSLRKIIVFTFSMCFSDLYGYLFVFQDIVFCEILFIRLFFSFRLIGVGCFSLLLCCYMYALYCILVKSCIEVDLFTLSMHWY